MKITNTLLNAAALLAVTEAATITKFLLPQLKLFLSPKLVKPLWPPNHLLKQFIQLHQNNSLVKLRLYLPNY